jgi:hypothetical protein
MDLKASLTKFVEIFHQSQENLGNVEILEPPIKIQPPFPLNSELVEYFSILRLDEPIIGGQFHLTLVSLDQLETAQQGWRWIRTKTGTLEEDNVHWNKKWTIIADRHGDVICVNFENNNVFGSIQKRNFFITECLSNFFETLADCMEIESQKYQNNTMDDDFNPLPDFLDDIKSLTLNKLGDEGSTGFMKFFFG